MVESLDGDVPDAIRAAGQRGDAASPGRAWLPHSVLRRAGLFRVLDAALAVPALADDRSRSMIVQLLRPDIATSVPRHQVASFDVWAILRTCSNHPGGLAELLDVVRAFEGDSVSMRRLSDDIAAEQQRSTDGKAAVARATPDLPTGQPAVWGEVPARNPNVTGRAVARDRLSAPEPAAYQRGAHELLTAANPGDPIEDPQRWPEPATLARQVLSAGLIDGTTPESRRYLANAVRSADHPHTRAVVNSVGADVRWQGRWRPALELDKDDLRRYLRVLGADNIWTLNSNNLAVDLRLLCDVDRVRRAAFSCYRTILGSDNSLTHPCTCYCLVNLAVLALLRDHAEVSTLLAEAGRHNPIYLEPSTP
jgi:Effector-associated domain 2